MNTQKQSNIIFLFIIAAFSVGALTGCQYCEPLLMATLVIGVIYNSLADSTRTESKHF